MDYKASGVDIDAGNEAVRRIRGLARSTFTPAVLSDIGSFGGLFRLEPGRFRDPVLVAERRRRRHEAEGGLHGRHARLGRRGSRQPLRQRHPGAGRRAAVLPRLPRDGPPAAARWPSRSSAAWRAACRENGCALLGGETAEMPGFYADGEYDLAGFIVGVVDRERLITGRGIAEGDVAHRRAVERAAHQRLLAGAPHRLRAARARRRQPRGRAGQHRGRGAARAAPLVSAAGAAAPRRRADQGHGAHHRRRASPTTCRASCRASPWRACDLSRWDVPPLFAWLQAQGRVPLDDMLRTFNMGVGLIIVTAPGQGRPA